MQVSLQLQNISVILPNYTIYGHYRAKTLGKKASDKEAHLMNKIAKMYLALSNTYLSLEMNPIHTIHSVKALAFD